MHKLTVTLEQHTPQIHFQSEQYGAILRASEVKPLLDRFLLKKISKEVLSKGELEGWIKEHDGLKTFDYKMSIVSDTENGVEDIETLEMNRPKKNNKTKYSRKYQRDIPDLSGYPLFFANMDIDYESDYESIKKLRNIPFLKMKLISKGMPLQSIINGEIICEFFMTHNFGTRHSKGFGSYYPEKEDKLYVKPKSTYNFLVKCDSQSWDVVYKNLFTYIELFYKSLRGGINLKDKNKNTVFYFKSLAYMYAADVLQAHWDKKAVKTKLFDLREKGEIFSKFYDIRDLLGYSTSEQWYGKSIEKTVPTIRNGEYRFPSDNDELLAERMESPILFKPIYRESIGDYRVHIIFQDEKVGLEMFKGISKLYIFTNDNKKFLIDLPRRFSTEDYFNYIFETLKIEVSEHVDNEYHDREEFEILNDIYTQLKENKK